MDNSKGSGPLYFDTNQHTNNLAIAHPLPLGSEYELLSALAGSCGQSQETKLEAWQKLSNFLSDEDKLKVFTYRFHINGRSSYENNRQNIMSLLVDCIQVWQIYDASDTTNLNKNYIVSNQMITKAQRAGVSVFEKDTQGLSFVAKMVLENAQPILSLLPLLPEHPELFTDLTEDGRTLMDLTFNTLRSPEEMRDLVSVLPKTALEANLKALKTHSKVSHTQTAIPLIEIRLEKEMLEKKVVVIENKPNIVSKI